MKKDFSPIKTTEEREARFQKIMEDILKVDSVNLFEEYRARRAQKAQADVWPKVQAGEYFSGSDAVKSGLADSFGTIQKTLLRDFPDADLLFVPISHRRYMDRRYFDRSIKYGTRA